MTGFLGRLAARAIEPAALLGPRQPSMFETARFSDGIGDIAAGGRAPDAEAASIDAVSVASMPPRAATATPPAEGTAPVPDRRSRRGRPLSESAEGTPRGAPRGRAPETSPALASGPRIFPQASPTPHALATGVHGMATAQETSRHGTLTARAPFYPAPPVHASSPRAASTRTAGITSEPVVHVSIGRIELRATAPSKPMHRQDKRQGNALDDYLNQRGRPRP